MADSRTSRADSPDASTATMEFVRRAPSPHLSGMVTELIGYRELGAGSTRQSEAASLTVPLVISFGDPFAIGLSRPPGDNDRYANFAAGLHAGPVVIDSFGRSACVQINFTPLGARRFFAMPMHELTGKMVDLGDVLGPTGLALRERLGQEEDWQRRLDLTERFVMQRMSLAAPPSVEVSTALRTLLASGGRTRIAAIASDIGWSRKHLVNRFTDQLGLGPKAVARIIRFNRAAALSRGRDAPDWAGIAADCGYADQAHLVREFREMSGAPPTLRGQIAPGR